MRVSMTLGTDKQTVFETDFTAMTSPLCFVHVTAPFGQADTAILALASGPHKKLMANRFHSVAVAHCSGFRCHSKRGHEMDSGVFTAKYSNGQSRC